MNVFRDRKPKVYFCVDRPKFLSGIDVLKRVRLLQKRKYFLVVTSRRVKTLEKFSNVQLQSQFSSETIRILMKASHTLLAHHLLSDLVESVWMYVRGSAKVGN